MPDPTTTTPTAPSAATPPAASPQPAPAVPAPATGAPTSAEGGGELSTGAAAPAAAAPDQQPPAPADSAPGTTTPGGLQKRINDLTRKAREADQRARDAEAARLAAEQRLADLMAAPGSLTPPTDDLVPPTFETPEQFQRDMAAYTQRAAEQAAQRAVQADRARQIEQATREAQEAEATRIRATFAQRVAETSKELPDYDEVVNNPDVPISVPLAAAIAQHEDGPKLAYHLGTHLEEANRIAALPIVLQIAALGELAYRLKNPAASVSSAPAPIQPVRGGAAAAATPALGELSMEEYAAQRNRR